MDSVFFKQLVSGEPVEARLPYGEPFILEDYAKFIFNANELPRDVEQNEAFFRRFIIIEFGVTIEEEDRDAGLAQKIIADELPGVFNWVVSALDRLLEQKRFSNSEASTAILKEYRSNSDSVNLFLEDKLYQKSLVSEISLHVLYLEYNKHSVDSGYRPVSKRIFSDRLKQLNFELSKRNFGQVVHIEKIVV